MDTAKISKPIFNKPFLFPLFILAVIVVLYGPSTGHFFIQDDFKILYDVKNNFNPCDIFITKFFHVGKYPFYRPITRDIFYRSAYTLFGLNPLGFHIINLALFFINSLFVYLIAEKLTKRKDIALFASLCYVSRGAHFTKLYWIAAGFQEMGVVFFVLCTVLLYLHYSETKRTVFYLLSLLCSLLAFMAKETSIIVPLLIVLLELYHGTIKTKTTLKRILPFFCVTLLYCIRLSIIKTRLISGNYKLVLSPDALGTVIKNIIFYIINTFNNTPEIFIACILVFIAILDKGNRKFALFSTAWFFIGLLPFILLAGHARAYYFSISLVGFSLLVASAVKWYHDKFSFSKFILTPILLAMLLFSGYMAVKKNEKTSGIMVKEKIAYTVLSYLLKNFPSFPDGSLLYIKNPHSDASLCWALGWAHAIRLYYTNDIKIYFENVLEKLPKEYRQSPWLQYSTTLPADYSRVYYFLYNYLNKGKIFYFLEQSRVVE